METGRAAWATQNPSDLTYPGKNQPAPGAVVTFPAGKYNNLRIEYFQLQSHQAGFTPSKHLTLFGTDHASGYANDAGYNLQNVKT